MKGNALTMTKEEILARVKAIINEQCGVPIDRINLDSSFTGDLGLDSLDVVELIMAIEQAWGTTIPDEKAESLVTVSKVVDFIFGQ